MIKREFCSDRRGERWERRRGRMKRLERVAVVAKAPEGTRGSRGGYHNRTVSPYGLVENLCFVQRNLCCKIDGFIKVGLKDEEKIL